MTNEYYEGYDSPEMLRLRLLTDIGFGVVSALFVSDITHSIIGGVVAGWFVCMGTDKYINPIMWEVVKDRED